MVLVPLLVFALLELRLRVPNEEEQSGKSLRPHLAVCEGKCLHDGVVCAADERPGQPFVVPFVFNSSRQKTDSERVALVNGTVVAWHCRSGNLNLAWHDDFWGFYAWARIELAPASTVIMRKSKTCSPWMEKLFDLLAEQREWRVIKAGSDEKPGGWVCATGELLLAGNDRKLTFAHGSILDVAQDVRSVVGSESRRDTSSRTVIYTGQDAKWGRIEGDTALLAGTFRRNKKHGFQVDVINRLPKTLEQQAIFFRHVGLFVAPKGEWTPSVLLMQPSTCVVELQQYAEDSWLRNFGLGATIADLITVTEDFIDPETRVIDDAFLCDGKLEQAIRSAVAQSRMCRHFLRHRLGSGTGTGSSL